MGGNEARKKGEEVAKLNASLLKVNAELRREMREAGMGPYVPIPAQRFIEKGPGQSTDEEIAAGTVVDLTFSLPGFKKPIACKGEVVRLIKATEESPDRRSGIGIRFTTFRGDSQKRLERYIAKTSDKDNRMIYYL